MKNGKIIFKEGKDAKSISEIEEILKTLKDIPIEINDLNQKFEFNEKRYMDCNSYTYMTLSPLQFRPVFVIGKSAKYGIMTDFDIKENKPLLRAYDKKSKKIVCDFYLPTN